MNSKKEAIRMFMAAALLLSVLLFCPGTVRAQEYDSERQGSISIALDDIDTDFSGAAFVCYKVAELADGEEMVWEPVDDLAGITSDFFDRETAREMQEAARVLEDQVVSANLSGSEAKTDSAGKAVFAQLPQGMYLIVQKDTGSYGAVEPFLVSVPYTSEGTQWVYDVCAQVKGEPLEAEKPSPPAKESEVKQPVVTQEPPSKRETVKTGDTSNVIAICCLAAAAGILCVAFGTGLLIRKRKSHSNK